MPRRLAAAMGPRSVGKRWHRAAQAAHDSVLFSTVNQARPGGRIGDSITIERLYRMDEADGNGCRRPPTRRRLERLRVRRRGDQQHVERPFAIDHVDRLECDHAQACWRQDRRLFAGEYRPGAASRASRSSAGSFLGVAANRPCGSAARRWRSPRSPDGSDPEAHKPGRRRCRSGGPVGSAGRGRPPPARNSVAR